MSIIRNWPAIFDMLPRGEQGIPGTPGDFDYATKSAAAAVVIPILRQNLRTADYAAPGDRGGGNYIRVVSDPGLGGFPDFAGNGWWALDEAFVNPRQFGCKGDNATDDTERMQDFIDYCRINNRMGRIPKGTYIVGPLWFNGRAWRDGGKPQTGAQDSMRGMAGEGMIYFGATFRAKAGAYAAGDAMLTGRNLTYKVLRGLHFDGNNIAPVGLDLEWVGSASGVPGTAAPACANTFSDILVENVITTGINLDQAVADSYVHNISYRGGTPEVGLTAKLPGGAFALTDCKLYRGRFDFCCQNANFNGCLFVNGVRVTSAAHDLVTFNGSQFFSNPTTGFCLESLTDPGSHGPNGFLFTGCYFIGGSNHTYYFSGRFRGGAKFIACYFAEATNTFFDPVGFVAAAVNGPPVFDFEMCGFAGAVLAFPASIPTKVIVTLYACIHPSGTLSNSRILGADLFVGPDGRIELNRLIATVTGIYLRGQSPAVVPTDATLGQGWNRSGSLNEVEQFIPGDVFRVTKHVAGVFTTLLTYNAGAANGLYPGTDNVRNCGIASNRWAAVYAGNGAIQTSDARLKTAVRPFTENELKAAKILAKNIGFFSFTAAVIEKEKQGIKAREHCGMTVQYAMKVMEDCGLDPFNYGFICYDKWDEIVVHYEEQYEEIYDDTGQLAKGDLITPAYDDVTEAGDLFSFRTDQLGMFMLRGIAATVYGAE